MTAKINSYFAVLLITLAGAGATWIIVRVAFANTFETVVQGDRANYAALQQSILGE